MYVLGESSTCGAASSRGGVAGSFFRYFELWRARIFNDFRPGERSPLCFLYILSFFGFEDYRVAAVSFESV